MLSFAQPSFTIVKQGPEKHLLVSLCVHGNETCGLLAFNELLQASPLLCVQCSPSCLPVAECWLTYELVAWKQCSQVLCGESACDNEFACRKDISTHLSGAGLGGH